jgi:hypothetical protein
MFMRAIPCTLLLDPTDPTVRGNGICERAVLVKGCLAVGEALFRP